MITSNSINRELANTLNDFTADCQENANTIKNGNSLKMEIELQLYKEAGKTTFLNSLELIHTKIARILKNIKVKK